MDYPKKDYINVLLMCRQGWVFWDFFWDWDWEKKSIWNCNLWELKKKNQYFKEENIYYL